MNIKLYGTSLAGRDYSSYRTSSVADTVKRPSTEPAGSYDKLTLHQTQYPSDAGQFARVLAKETARAASIPVSSTRVQELQRQVAAGTYQPDADLIAKRMLCYS